MTSSEIRFLSSRLIIYRCRINSYKLRNRCNPTLGQTKGALTKIYTRSCSPPILIKNQRTAGATRVLWTSQITYSQAILYELFSNARIFARTFYRLAHFCAKLFGKYHSAQFSVNCPVGIRIFGNVCTWKQNVANVNYSEFAFEFSFVIFIYWGTKFVRVFQTSELQGSLLFFF